MDIKKSKQKLDIIDVTLSSEELEEIVKKHIMQKEGLNTIKVSFNIGTYYEDRRSQHPIHELSGVSCKAIKP